MIERDVRLPAEVDWARVASVVEGVCSAAGLQARTKGTLARYPGCVHWHYGRAPDRGTLEITFWPLRARLWFKVSAGRRAAWIMPVLPLLKREIEAGLRGLEGR